MKRHQRTAAAALIGAVLLATGCASTDQERLGDSVGGADGAAASPSRVAIGYAGGVAVLDADTLDVLDSFDTEEFTRLNSFGDDRTIAVTTSEGFQMLDTQEPALTDVVLSATAPGHVVAHDGTTALYDDGTGVTTILASEAFAEGYEGLPAYTTYAAEAAHHGVSIVLSDGTMLTTVGDETGRSGAQALHPHDDHWHTDATSQDCPGIHGEGTAADEAVVFGCDDGALLYVDGVFTKLAAPDDYGRAGNLYVSDTSPIAVGDYRDDPDAEGYLLHAVTLIDTEAKTLDVVNLPGDIGYTFRDIARGPGDLAYILATDGHIHVLDPTTGELIDAYAVVAPWEEPREWQDPHPAITVAGDIAYVTEPASKTVHAVNLVEGAIVTSAELEHAPNEIAVAGN